MTGNHRNSAVESSHPFWAILLPFLRLGLTSFGGPIAHLGYFRHEFVERQRWVDEHTYADLVGLCQFLPGPTSTQVGMALGFSRGGIPGAIAAWMGFTLPSALLLILFALGRPSVEKLFGLAWLHGLKIVSVAVVAHAIWAMGRAFCPDMLRTATALLAPGFLSVLPSTLGQMAVIATGALIGVTFVKGSEIMPHNTIKMSIPPARGSAFLTMFVLLLVLLPILAATTTSNTIKLFDMFYRAGALVFGGGHVVLPLLQSQVVPNGWVGNDAFLAGYGAAQGVPGPLFAFAAYLGAMSLRPPSGWEGASIALVAIFLPSFLLLIGILPLWERLRSHVNMKRAILGINAAVVGILLAAFIDPVLTSAVRNAGDVAVAFAAFVLLAWWKWNVWLVLALTIAISSFLSA
jgi:chromate transporter